MTQEVLRIIPLGGLGEFGRNMMVYEYGDTLFCIDAGLMFPDDELLGIDAVISDISYLLERKEKLKGIVLTHGHEDHIGALPYILPDLQTPIYGSPLTIGLVQAKLREHKLLDRADLRVIRAGEWLNLGSCQLEFIHVCHSIPDTIAIAVHSPVGVLLHITDYKFDAQPVDGKLTDEARLKELGDAGIRVLLADSTNAETPGFTPSERELETSLNEIISKASGRVIVASFASNISRVQQVVNVATRNGRKVGMTGRSMLNNTQMASDMGYLRLPGGGPLRAEQLQSLPPDEVVVICTGSQGEPTSALVRMSENRYPYLHITPGDTVIVSATPIPGNERTIHRTIDSLFRLGADVYYDRLMDVHVSGHGSREDQRHLLKLTRPQHLIPIHGSYRQLVLHARLGQSEGLTPQHTHIIENGRIIEVSADAVSIGEQAPTGRVLIDGLGIGDIGQVVLRDRQKLSKDGFVAVVLGLDEKTGDVLLGPEIVSRGFVYFADATELIDDVKEVVWSVLDAYGSVDAVTRHIHDDVAEFCQRRTGRRPMILPLIVEL